VFGRIGRLQFPLTSVSSRWKPSAEAPRITEPLELPPSTLRRGAPSHDSPAQLFVHNRRRQTVVTNPRLRRQSTEIPDYQSDHRTGQFDNSVECAGPAENASEGLLTLVVFGVFVVQEREKGHPRVFLNGSKRIVRKISADHYS